MIHRNAVYGVVICGVVCMLLASIAQARGHNDRVILMRPGSAVSNGYEMVDVPTSSAPQTYVARKVPPQTMQYSPRLVVSAPAAAAAPLATNATPINALRSRPTMPASNAAPAQRTDKSVARPPLAPPAGSYRPYVAPTPTVNAAPYPTRRAMPARPVPTAVMKATPKVVEPPIAARPPAITATAPPMREPLTVTDSRQASRQQQPSGSYRTKVPLLLRPQARSSASYQAAPTSAIALPKQEQPATMPYVAPPVSANTTSAFAVLTRPDSDVGAAVPTAPTLRTRPASPAPNMPKPQKYIPETVAVAAIPAPVADAPMLGEMKDNTDIVSDDAKLQSVADMPAQHNSDMSNDAASAIDAPDAQEQADDAFDIVVPPFLYENIADIREEAEQQDDRNALGDAVITLDKEHFSDINAPSYQEMVKATVDLFKDKPLPVAENNDPVPPLTPPDWDIEYWNENELSELDAEMADEKSSDATMPEQEVPNDNTASQASDDTDSLPTPAQQEDAATAQDDAPSLARSQSNVANNLPDMPDALVDDGALLTLDSLPESE